MCLNTSLKIVFLYTTIYPETSTNSPSAKSKGVRFVSGNDEVNQTNAE